MKKYSIILFKIKYYFKDISDIIKMFINFVKGVLVKKYFWQMAYKGPLIVISCMPLWLLNFLLKNFFPSKKREIDSIFYRRSNGKISFKENKEILKIINKNPKILDGIAELIIHAVLDEAVFAFDTDVIVPIVKKCLSFSPVDRKDINNYAENIFKTLEEFKEFQDFDKEIYFALALIYRYCNNKEGIEKCADKLRDDDDDERLVCFAFILQLYLECRAFEKLLEFAEELEKIFVCDDILCANEYKALIDYYKVLAKKICNQEHSMPELSLIDIEDVVSTGNPWQYHL